jgi:hypothetical protein
MSRARHVLELVSAAAVGDLQPLFAPRLRGWDAEPWLREWARGLALLVGQSCEIVSETRVTSTLTRFELAGRSGTAVATVLLDDEGRWFGAQLKRRATEGIANIVLQCSEQDRPAMQTLYDEVLGLDPFDVPVIVFDEGRADDPRPRWPDPKHPQQMHLDIQAGDVDAIDAIATRHGATRLAEFDDHNVYSDVVGHPFCLYRGDADTTLRRLVIDSPDPDSLESFYTGLLGTATTPQLAFQYSAAEPPRWPDPAHPAQVHVDLMFDDPTPVAARVVELGGVLLRPREGFPVYADPAGHPFCLGRPGE